MNAPELVIEQKPDLDDASPILNDHFFGWARSVVPGWLDDNNIRLLHHCINHLPTSDPVIEIGAFCGLSTIAIARMLDLAKAENTLISVDPWRFEDVDFSTSIRGSSVAWPAFRGLVKDTYLNAIKTLAGMKPVHFEEYSSDFFHKWTNDRFASDSFGRDMQLGGPISMAYIDGDHKYAAAKLDFINCDRFLVPGGFIVLDDSADGTDWGSHQVAKEVLDSHAYDLVAKAPNYCFMKRVR